MTDSNWFPGDLTGLSIPADAETLRPQAARFLTNAFHASGALAKDNSVTHLPRFEPRILGGTGAKLFISVAYAHPAPNLPTELFVKFSRNFTDRTRDASRHMLESEIQFAALSRLPGFPIAVPECMFADNHRKSGTGMIVTPCLRFGADGIEPHYEKCMDMDVPEPLAHYKAIMVALARLSGTHKAGKLSPRFDAVFPFSPTALVAADKFTRDVDQFQSRVGRIAEFAAAYPRLLPQNIASPAFLARMAADIPVFVAHEIAIKEVLLGQPKFIALCHWNANIDNAWFWRDAAGELTCGLIDWGRVGQMSIAQAIYGAFSSAETALWDNHLEEIVATFAAEFERCGGPPLDRAELTLHVQLTTQMMGLRYLMDAPAVLRQQMPDLANLDSPFDPRFRDNEIVRMQLKMMTMFLNLWETRDTGGAVRRLLNIPT